MNLAHSGKPNRKQGNLLREGYLVLTLIITNTDKKIRLRIFDEIIG